jgi:hypothetical protein
MRSCGRRDDIERILGSEEVLRACDGERPHARYVHRRGSVDDLALDPRARDEQIEVNPRPRAQPNRGESPELLVLDERSDLVSSGCDVARELLRIGVRARRDGEVDVSSEAHLSADRDREPADERELAAESP